MRADGIWKASVNPNHQDNGMQTVLVYSGFQQPTNASHHPLLGLAVDQMHSLAAVAPTAVPTVAERHAPTTHATTIGHLARQPLLPRSADGRGRQNRHLGQRWAKPADHQRARWHF